MRKKSFFFWNDGEAWGTISISPLARFWALLLPFLGWLALHNWGNVAPGVDNSRYVNWVAYHFDYIIKGIFPLWDPFHGWGWPNLTDARMIGEFNPLYLLVPFLMIFQVPALIAITIFLIGLHVLGGLGFYMLVRDVWDDEFPALLAYVMYMFSTIGELIFAEYAVALLLVPTIWFFVFLLRFIRAESLEGQKTYFLGLVLTTAIIVVTYLPFFFLIILSAVVLAVCLARPALFPEIFRKILTFAKGRPLAFWCGLGVVIMACLPGFIWYLSRANGNMAIFDNRNGLGQTNGADVPLAIIGHSSMGTQTSLGEIFSDQDFVMNSFAYVPAFLVLLLSLGMLTRMGARHRIIFITCFIVFIFSLAGATPVHGFLYQYVFFVRMFRNLYFFGPFLILLLTLLGVGQIRLWMQARPQNSGERGRYVLFILLVHAALIFALVMQERVFWTSYATFFGSAVFFLAYAFGFFDKKRGWFMAGLLCLAVLQPVQLIAKFRSVWAPATLGKFDMKDGSFSYVRPLRGQFPEREINFLEGAPKQKQDDSGFINNGFYGAKYPAMLFQNVPAQDLQNYVSHKFVLYDRVAYLDGDRPDWAAIGHSLGTIKSPAFVHDKRAVHSSSGAIQDKPPIVLSGPSNMLTVVRFEPDRIQMKTSFSRPKFLVYNDGYYPDWTAFVNGKKVPLYRANVAFKGIWVDAGAQTVEFRFGTWWQHGLRWAFMALLGILLVYVTVLCLKGKKCVFLKA